MKSIAAIALFVAATFVPAGNASAQESRSIATVPFSFAVGNHTLPPGTYTMTSGVNSPNLLAVSSREKGAFAMTFGQPDQDNPQHANVLVFDRIGDKYYLREVRSSSSSLNIHFPTTKAEKRARAQVEDAGLFVNDPVLIALN